MLSPNKGTERPAFLIALLFVGVLSLCGCSTMDFSDYAKSQLTDKPDSRILVIGDSVMSWNAQADASIADVLERTLGHSVVNLAVPGARLSHPDANARASGFDIRAQYRPHDWDWVVVDGGANDLGDECDCRRCDQVMDTLISADGARGEIASLVQTIIHDGARVVVLGYYAPPDQGGELRACKDELAELSGRIERLASHSDRVRFVPMADLVAPNDPAAYDPDLVHPSKQSSVAIGRRIAAEISD